MIFAPATTAPVWSVTMPVTSELACANAPAHANMKNSGNSNTCISRVSSDLPFQSCC